jgi:hypothetical protein
MPTSLLDAIGRVLSRCRVARQIADLAVRHCGKNTEENPNRNEDARTISFAGGRRRAGKASFTSADSHRFQVGRDTCGPIVRLRLLLTPSRDDAITFSYGVVAFSGTDLHRAAMAPSWAHN